MANSVGGVLVLGIREEEGSAAELTAVPAEDEGVRIRQIVASLVSPLPAIRLTPVPSSDDATQGSWLIEVPRSASAPHAVRVGDALRYPRRYGAMSGFMRESEVADRYRSRFAAAVEQTARVRRVRAEGTARINHGETAWLALALVPNTSGEMEIRHRTVRNVMSWAIQKQNLMPSPAAITRGL